MSSFDERVSIEPLTRENYLSWSEDLKAMLLERDAWGIVKGTEEPPAATAPAKERKDYQARHRRGYSTIFLHMSKDLRSLISEIEDPKEAWDTLKEHFLPKSRARLIGLFDTFFQTRPEGEEPIGLFAARLRKLVMQIRDAGFVLDDIFQSFQLIRFLPSEYSGAVGIIYDWEDEKFKFDNVLKRLLSEEARLKQSMADLESRNSSLFHSNIRKNTPSKSSSSKTKTCSFCKKKGHDAAQCRKKKATSFAANVGTSFIAETNLNTSTVDSNSWIFDTAASAHFTGDRSLFQNFQTVHDRQMSVAVGDSTYPIEGMGNIELSFKEDPDSTLTLLNVLYSPKINRNLISGSKFDEAQAKFIGGKNKISVFTKTGKRLFTAKKQSGLYHCFPNVKSKSKFKKNSSHSANATKTSFSDFRTWHRKFCHINSRFIVNTSKNGSVRGLPEFKHSKFHCEECKIAKAKRKSHKPIEDGPRSEAPLELIHSDLCGPFPINSIQGHRFFLTFVDDYSKRTTVYLLKSKTEVFDFFTRYQKRAENFLGRKIKNVRTDQGLEYIHEKFKVFLAKQGIKAERSNVYTPEQNGTAERFNLTAVDAVKTMLKDSSLNNSFWAEAVLCFTYVWNRICHSNQTKTPFELYGGQSPSVKHFQIFGSKAYVVIPKQLRRKLDMRAKTGVMVGYAMQTRGYRIWLPAENKVIETNDVRFGDPSTTAESSAGSKLDPPRPFIFHENQIPSSDSDDDSDDKPAETQKQPVVLSNKPVATTSTPDVQQPQNQGNVWVRQAIPRKDNSRVDIYYKLQGTDIKLNSSVQAKEYCKVNNLKFSKDFFDFSGGNHTSGIVPGNLETINVSIENDQDDAIKLL
ncbi:retrovirus-related gag-pol polyprotein [Lasius niger]|uniref:Retrovirus-related gag-pol polyprotein n=1 Tax=Lasius niger TaxID=67767 RepID=A0A0J7K7U6_LASNI|nr:retrovirus-related gag-pol polyprotein [Lasius niger]